MESQASLMCTLQAAGTKGKPRQVVAKAIAREQGAFLWAIEKQVQSMV